MEWPAHLPLVEGGGVTDRGLLLLGYFGFKSLVNDLIDLRP